MLDLTQISLHDCPLDSITLSFEQQRISLVVSLYEEDKQSYQRVSISFIGVTTLHTNGQLLIRDAEVYDHTIVPVGGKLNCSFTIISGKISFQLEFSCQDYDTQVY